MKKGFVHIYTGKGKGKTTAALGLILRALGRKKRVLLVQLMKSGEYGEIKSLQKLSGITIKQFGTGKFLIKGKVSPKEMDLAHKALAYIDKASKSGDYDLMVLDELIVAAHFGLVSQAEISQIIKNKPADLELVLTGRKASAKIIKQADLVTEMKEVKHYFRQGIKARSGIEY